jgi:tetratricopeptide (TPR) repeat protein
MRRKLLLFVPLAVCVPSATLRAQPPDPVAVYARGDYAGVVKLLAARVRRDPNAASIQHRLILARAQLHLDRDEQALAVLRSVLATDRENPEANHLMGQTLLARGRHADALDYLEHAYRLKPTAANASALGKCHYALGHVVKAKPLLEQALKEDIRDPSNSFLLGRICLQRGLGALAERHLLAAQEAGMDTIQLHRLLGRAYMLQRKWAGPILLRRRSGAPEPGDVVNGHVVLGPVAGRPGHFRVATRYGALYEGLRLWQAKARGPEVARMIARGWLAAGEVERAEQMLKSLPDRADAEAERLAADVLIAAGRFGDLDGRLSAAPAAERLTPREIAGYYYRAGAALRAEGRRDEARTMLRKAEKLTPTSGKVLRALGGLALAAGDRRQARRYYARLVELQPDAPDADELRNTLRGLEDARGGRR